MIEPTVLNVICPQCSKSWLVPLTNKTYFCYACQYVMLEKQIKESQLYAAYNTEGA